MLEEDARLTALFLWTIQKTAVATSGKEEQENDNDEMDVGDNEEDGTSQKKGLTLVYDVVRRFAQPLGIHLDQWQDRIIETDKGVVRLLPVRERAVQLFGEVGAATVARRIESAPQIEATQGSLFPELARRVDRGSSRKQHRARPTTPDSAADIETRRQSTTLDRVHAAMLLQDSGASNALRVLLRTEVERGAEFLRLANALSALYPIDSDEKRLLDAMLLALPK
jgi:hypothetical protein